MAKPPCSAWQVGELTESSRTSPHCSLGLSQPQHKVKVISLRATNSWIVEFFAERHRSPRRTDQFQCQLDGHPSLWRRLCGWWLPEYTQTTSMRSTQPALASATHLQGSLRTGSQTRPQPRPQCDLCVNRVAPTLRLYWLPCAQFRTSAVLAIRQVRAPIRWRRAQVGRFQTPHAPSPDQHRDRV